MQIICKSFIIVMFFTCFTGSFFTSILNLTLNDADKLGAAVTEHNDPRISRAGDKLRKVRLDELPQLFNVLLGDMSFVGVRPEVAKYVNRYTDEMNATAQKTPVRGGEVQISCLLYSYLHFRIMN